MLSNNRISFIRSLQQKKFREEHRLFVAEGDKLVREMLNSGFTVQQVCGVESWIVDNHANAMKAESSEVVKVMDMERMSSMTTAPEVLAVVEIPEYDINEVGGNQGLVLILDGIRDPGNMGTLIRTADWFGIRDIIASEDSVEFWNPKVIQATMGSISRVRLHSSDLSKAVNLLRQNAAVNNGAFAVYGAAMEGTDVYKTEWSKSGALIIGNESNGIRGEISELLDVTVAIPRAENSGAESLNAGIAAGILMSEYFRSAIK
jgi:TrmH family RNA methyltransferase